ncbi:MAG: tetratricopeptide repeat protein [Dolichospermum sp.]
MYVNAYFNRGTARYHLGDKQGAIDDYTQAIKIPNYVNAYFNRGNVRNELGDKQSAIKDFQTAANIYKKEGKETNYQKAIEIIREITAVFMYLYHTLIFLFLSSFASLRLPFGISMRDCVRYKMWFIYPKIAVTNNEYKLRQIRKITDFLIKFFVNNEDHSKKSVI